MTAYQPATYCPPGSGCVWCDTYRPDGGAMAERRRHMTIAELKGLDAPTSDLLDYGNERSQLHHLVEKLVAIREERNMSQRDVAKIIGCSSSTVSRFESYRGFPSGAWMIPSYAYAVGAWLSLDVRDEWWASARH